MCVPSLSVYQKVWDLDLYHLPIVICVLVCVQLAPVVQSTLSYDASSSVPEPTLHKDDLDSILGDVSHSQLHIRIMRYECCNNGYRQTHNRSTFYAQHSAGDEVKIIERCAGRERTVHAKKKVYKIFK